MVFYAWFSRRPAARPVTSETFAVRLASKRVVSFNGEVFSPHHNLHRVDGGRADTSIFRLARDDRGEAPNRRNAHNNGACGYDSCSHVGAPFKTNMSAQLGFTFAFPSQKISNEKAGWPIADLELNRTRLAQI